jgi:lipopolysaccharide/colanic/teichoic acid biosynthesis glycosyltransferase
MSFEQFWTIIGKQWRLIVICFPVLGLETFIGSKLMTPIYQSSALVQVAVRSSNSQADYNSLLASDQRVTRIGRFMRATHLDELPQVINILRGEMTLIGPRPERPEYVAELAKSNSRYRYRLGVKPGLTGWAQVNYGYGNSYRDDLIKLQYDLHYIENRSIKLDLFILMKTVMEVVRHRGDQ